MGRWLHDCDVDGVAREERAEEIGLLKQRIVWNGLCLVHHSISPPHSGIGMGRRSWLIVPFRQIVKRLGAAESPHPCLIGIMASASRAGGRTACPRASREERRGCRHSQRQGEGAMFQLGDSLVNSS